MFVYVRVKKSFMILNNLEEVGMVKKYNILVSCARGQESDACSEIWYFISELGDQDVQCDNTGIPGLVAVKTSLNAFEVVKKLKEMAMKDPWQFRYTLRYVPLEEVVSSKLDEIAETAAKLAEKIGENETFKIEVRKRYTTLSRTDIIEAAASKIERKVNLSNPDWIVNIEVVGKWTGISVLRPSDILSIAKIREK